MIHKNTNSGTLNTLTNNTREYVYITKYYQSKIKQLEEM